MFCSRLFARGWGRVSSSLSHHAGFGSWRNAFSSLSGFPRAFSSDVSTANAIEMFPGVDPEDLVPVTVDNKKILVPPGITVLQACEAAGVHVPRFCFHDKLSIAGNCRMCLVEMEKAKKPVASCAQPIMPGCVVKTTTPLVKTARESVMEFLLANHPLDCPICDQGGNCDLQDQAMNFGSDRGRYREEKSTVQDSYIGPIVKTVMTRCIQCTRCIRFAEEICGHPVLGTSGRGQATEVGTYVDAVVDSELSGNLIDLCPVGALTSLPNAFTYRSWEVENVETIDVSDGVGSNMTVDVRGNKIMGMKARSNEDINEDWIPDKCRYSWDGLKKKRLDRPLGRVDGRFQEMTWPDILELAASKIKEAGRNVKAIAGDVTDAETMTVTKDFLNRLGSNDHECRQPNLHVPADARSSYLFNSNIVNIEHADAVLFVGINPRHEGTIVNSRVRKSVLNFGLDVFQIGPEVDLGYRSEHVGTGPQDFRDFVNSTSQFGKQFREYENPIVIIGNQAFIDDYSGTSEGIAKLRSEELFVSEDWSGVSILNATASRQAGLDLGFVKGPSKSDMQGGVVILLGADEEDMLNDLDDKYVIYIGSHGDAGATKADIVLPGAAFTEKNATYVNIEGRVQRTKAVVSTIGHARVDWQIMRALAELCDVSLPYDDVDAVRQRMADISPTFDNLTDLEEASWDLRIHSDQMSQDDLPVSYGKICENYYTTSPISRNSNVMKQCIIELPTATNSYKDQKAIA